MLYYHIFLYFIRQNLIRLFYFKCANMQQIIYLCCNRASGLGPLLINFQILIGSHGFESQSECYMLMIWFPDKYNDPSDGWVDIKSVVATCRRHFAIEWVHSFPVLVQKLVHYNISRIDIRSLVDWLS